MEREKKILIAVTFCSFSLIVMLVRCVCNDNYSAIKYSSDWVLSNRKILRRKKKSTRRRPRRREELHIDAREDCGKKYPLHGGILFTSSFIF